MTENAGRKNDGPSKSRGVKNARHEIAGHDIDMTDQRSGSREQYDKLMIIE